MEGNAPDVPERGERDIALIHPFWRSVKTDIVKAAHRVDDLIEHVLRRLPEGPVGDRVRRGVVRREDFERVRHSFVMGGADGRVDEDGQRRAVPARWWLPLAKTPGAAEGAP